MKPQSCWLTAGLVAAFVVGGAACGDLDRPRLTEAAGDAASSSTVTSEPSTTTTQPAAVTTTRPSVTTTTRAATTTTTLLYGQCDDDLAKSAAACAKETLDLMGYWQHVASTSGTSPLTLTLKKGSESAAENVCSYTKIGFLGGPFEKKVGVVVRSSAGTLLRQSGAADTSGMDCYTDRTIRATTTTTIYIPPAPSYTTPTTPYVPPSGTGSIGSGGSGSCTYVDPYYRKDGTYVRGHWRGC